MVILWITGLLLSSCGPLTPIPTQALATPTYSGLPEATPAPGPAITLKSVSITKTLQGSKQVAVVYGKTIETCVHMITGIVDGQFTEGWKIVHEQNLFCDKTNYVSITIPIEKFDPTFKEGITVALCHGNNYNVCSKTVTVTFQGEK